LPLSRLTVFGAGELDAELEVDAAFAEGPLELLRRGLLLQRHQMRQGLDDRDLGPE
jgi:hypothetical protein